MAHAGQPITMVALGGSVTSGTGTFKLENTWVHRVFSWVQRVFPHEQHRYVAALTCTPGIQLSHVYHACAGVRHTWC